MSEKPVRVELSGAICTIILNRPDKRNAVDRQTATALREAFEAFERDAALQVAVLCGAGGTFCAGADLTALGDPARRNELDAEGRGPGRWARPGCGSPSRRSPRSPVMRSPAGSNWRCCATCGWSRNRRCSASSAGAGACR